jgi:hypothetical protein
VLSVSPCEAITFNHSTGENVAGSLREIPHPTFAHAKATFSRKVRSGTPQGEKRSSGKVNKSCRIASNVNLSQVCSSNMKTGKD